MYTLAYDVSLLNLAIYVYIANVSSAFNDIIRRIASAVGRENDRVEVQITFKAKHNQVIKNSA